MKRRLFLALCLLLAASACGPEGFQIPFLPTSTTEPAVTATPSPLPQPTGTKAASTPSTPQPAALRIWLPPALDPDGATAAGQILKARLQEYAAAHPEVMLDIRIKGAEGESGLLEALSLTRSAAPSALPDLVALSRPDLEAAAIKGALHPLAGITDELDGPDWYPYARAAGEVQDVTYGLPFAGDALVIAYHPSQFEDLPARWQELFIANKSLAFYADDPDSTFLLSLYLSTGSPLLDRSNNPFLDGEALTGVLQLLSDSRLVPLQSEQAAWTAFEDGRAQMAVVHTSRYLQADPLQDAALMPLPHPPGGFYSLATTWAWALAGSDPANDAAAAELAQYLVEDEFLSEWNRAGGYLSPRPNALNLWDPDGSLELISQSAQVRPGNDLLAAVGPLLREALTRVLAGEPPEAAAAAASEALR